MTVAIPAVSLPGAGTGRDITGRPPASGLPLIMSGPAAPVPGPGSHPAPPRWPGDRSGLWLRNAAAGLCVLAAAAAAVSFTAQYRMAEAARHLQVVAALEAAIPDAAALVFACLGIALALHGRRALRARALNLASVAASVFMNAIAAAPGWRNLAIWALPPVAYAWSDTLPLDWAAVTALLEPHRQPHRPQPGPAPGRDLSHLARWVASQAEGNRNAGLFWAANRALDADPAADLSPLAAAARQAGLGQREITRTLDSARNSGRTPAPDYQAEAGDQA